MMVFGSVFIGAWGVLHFFIPSLGDFGEQLQGVPNFTVDYILLINFMASLILIVFGILGVLVATRLWANAAAVKLIGWPTGLICLAYSGYILVKPWRVPFPVPTIVYVIGAALLALCFLIPALRR